MKIASKLFISIITPSFNRADELEYLFQSLNDQTIDPNIFESIISDDGSTDNTEMVVKTWQKKAAFRIKYITQNNQGPGSARNNGMKISKGDLILFIDSDCEAHPDWIQTIVNEYNKFGFDAFGGPDGAKENFSILQKAIDFSMTSFLTTGGMRGHSEKMIANFFPRSHNMGISRNIYKTLGGFGNLRHGQDIEFSNRIKKSGAEVKFIKDALVYHRRRTSLSQFLKQVFNWGVARINLAKIDPSLLEPIHFMPTFACFVLLLIVFITKYLDWDNLKIIFLLFMPLFFISLFGAISKKDLRIFPYLLIVIPSQVFGYGLGFLQAFIRRFIFNQPELVGFKKNYYQ